MGLFLRPFHTHTFSTGESKYSKLTIALNETSPVYTCFRSALPINSMHTLRHELQLSGKSFLAMNLRHSSYCLLADKEFLLRNVLDLNHGNALDDVFSDLMLIFFTYDNEIESFFTNFLRF
jgi:hypothetical protein